MKSIIDYPENRCAVCGMSRDLETHHIFFGQANRRLADADGLVCKLCWPCHRGQTGVHGGSERSHEIDLQLKEAAQYAWMKHYGKTEKDFLARYGRNYL